MRIDRLTLQNFRCFENETWEFAPGFNVLIGDNGTGKTAVLDALAILLSEFPIGFVQRPSKLSLNPCFIDDKDVRLIPSGTDELPTLEQAFPVRVATEGKVGEDDVQWEQTLLQPDG